MLIEYNSWITAIYSKKLAHCVEILLVVFARHSWAIKFSFQIIRKLMLNTVTSLVEVHAQLLVVITATD